MKPFERRQKMNALISQGFTDTHIASVLGVSRSTVKRARDKLVPRKGERAAHKVVSTRVTERELEGLDAHVRSEKGGSRGSVLRQMVRSSADFYAPRPDEEAFLKSSEAHLSRLGGNFNQIAAALSASVRKTGRADPASEQIKMMYQAADEVSAIRGVVKAMLMNAQVRSGYLKDRLEKPLFEDDADE